MSNRLQFETIPYDLQHKDNPVDWYPWCKEAFEKARAEDKPIFLSIGYSACHWCHVLAHESFEDREIAELLNQYYISVKVDKEERPDIDSVYMSVCQAFTGSGGWPTSIFMTWDQKPFFAGTYFPRTAGGGRIGMRELLLKLHEIWTQERDVLLRQSKRIMEHLREEDLEERAGEEGTLAQQMIHLAAEDYESRYDPQYGGFGQAPKFPTPHNLLFLLNYYERYKKGSCLEMAEHTLLQMYRGGMFDHIGFGFCRYSTDRMFLVPHFEKMLYDNALLLMAYTQAYSITGKEVYREVVRKTAQYIQREMSHPEGGFYSAQDADSQGVEGRHYVFACEELTSLLGETAGKKFNEYFHITREGNFEGKSIPNRLGDDMEESAWHAGEGDYSHTEPERLLPKVYAYRKQRCQLFLDDKILTSWNGLMIGAFARMYRVFGQEGYLRQATAAYRFLNRQQKEDGALFVSWRKGVCQGRGFLEDYAFYAFGLIELYSAALDPKYLTQAEIYCQKAQELFADQERGGFYLCGEGNEKLIATPKETYDGAIPSGNSVMAYNLVKLWQITGKECWRKQAAKQLDFLSAYAAQYPSGQSFSLLAALLYQNPPEHIVGVLKEERDLKKLQKLYGRDADIVVLWEENREYERINNRATLYICRDDSCRPPVNL